MTGQIQDGQLSADLKKLRDDKRTIDQLNGVDVEFELEGTILKQIRRKGETFVAAAAPPPQSAQHRGQQGRDQTQRGRKDSRTQSQPASQKPEKSMPESAFHNPYNFVPAPPRQTDHPDLGDHAPIGQHVLHPDRYTGVIHVKLTVQTPLLLPDAANAQDCPNDHKSFPVRVDAEGKPYLPPTSIKGMLRSAYEAVTNSRLAVFPGVEASQSRDATGHGARLAFRRPARVEVVPARIEACDAQQLTVRILSQLWLRSAAKLPRYVQRPGREQRTRKGEAQAALRYPDGSLPQHGDHVRVTVNAKGRVERIVRFEGSVAHEGDEGWVLITEPNIGNKKYERVYVVSPKDRLLQFQGADALQIRQMWNELINDYRQTHVKDLEQRRQRNQQPTDYLGDTPGQTAWSRQIWDDRYRQLHEGTLCYVRLNGSAITGIYPVSISRDLYSVSPLSLLHPSLRPATALTQLSPADRVFGWVNQQGHGSCKGNVRVGPVTCVTPAKQAIENFGTPGLPLAILGQPKPQQARFYVAKTPNGKAQGDRLSKQDAGYSPGKGLRGRKVYPHHQGLPDGHWDNAMQDRTQQADNGHFQEYRRPRLNGQEQRDNQNRSIQGWVKPGTVFRFDLHVTNLSKVELGALLWLLSLPDNRFHRLGGGKPLGFGSVRLEIDADNTHLHDGHGWKEIYGTLDDTTPPETNRDEIVRAFQEAVRTSYGSPASFDQVPFIAAWLKMATGHSDNLPTHYPRARQQGQNGPVPPHPEGLAYEWFVANDRTGQNGGPQVSLPDLETDNGLPML
jgi:CRISPR-associated protein (TIGR03986 family)